MRLILGAFVFAAVASSAQASTGLDDLKKFVGTSQTARGDFVQKVMRGNGAVQESSGQFALMRPAKFKWQTLKPLAQTMVSDGESLFFHDPGLNQVIQKSAAQALESSPAGILFGNGGIQALQSKFQLKDLGEKDGRQWIEALPKTDEGSFRKIMIGMRRGVPETLDVLDAFGQTTQIQFRNLQTAIKLEASEFRFSVPAGADLLKQ